MDETRAISLSLERNLALIAGAGSGKTHSLVTVCLQLLAGARRGGVAVRPPQLFMVTFTDKAAAEMRDRLRRRVQALARNETQGEAAVLEAFGGEQRAPGPLVWRQVADQLGAATVGTLHSLCAQILRQAPLEAGVDPGFQVLEERDAQELIRDAAERLVLDQLQRQQPTTVALCRELGFSGGQFPTGLVDHLCQVFLKSREQVAPGEIAVSDPTGSVSELETAVRRVRELVKNARAFDRPSGGRFGPLLAQCERALDGLSLSNFLEPDRYPALRQVIESQPHLARQRNGAGELLKELKGWVVANGSDHLTLLDYYGGCAVMPFEQGFRALLGELEQRFRAELAKRSCLDFSELLIRTRDVLRDSLAARAETHARMGALLVDEFQDTNRLQFEIVTLLAEKREGGPRHIPPKQDGECSLPLEPGFLCVVGDAKQSIYDFRGADVGVFGRMASKIEREGGRLEFLTANRRSAPGLVSFWNPLFAHLMSARAEPREYESLYRPEHDDQLASRSTTREMPPVDWLVFEPSESAEQCRLQDARAIAGRIGQLLSPEAAAMVEGEDGAPRPARGGDFAILFRRFTFLEVYRQALSELGIPHRVIRGRGFYGAQEVVDIASLLSLIGTSEDALALAAVLRSPFVALSDVSLFKLGLSCDGRLSLRGLEHLPSFAELNLPDPELRRLERFLGIYHRLRREMDRLGVRSLLRVALEELGYRVAVAGTPFGEQALANLDKVLDLAERWDAAGKADCQGFAQRMRDLADEDPSEAQADVLDIGDPRAVQLMTIHQAKGLEFPIVVLPDLAAHRNRGGGRVLYDRDLGLSIRPWVGEDSQNTRSPRHRRLGSELMRREDAEYVRLLYVAMTRARDRLILSGQNRRSAGTWLEMLENASKSHPAIRSSIQRLRADEIRVPSKFALPSQPSEQELVEVRQAITRVRRRSRNQSQAVVFPVTHLQDYVFCPRRYLYARHLGLLEFPVVLDTLEKNESQHDAVGSDYRQRGTLAHRLLESVELSWVQGADADLRQHLADLLWAQGVEPDGDDGRKILGWVHRFLRTPFAARLANAGPDRVHRELPFMLRLGEHPAVYLKGQIDLLFEDEAGGATVIDYKASRRHPRGVEAYRFQLDCYALAARRFVKEGVRIQTGIAFLAEGCPEPEIRHAQEFDLESFQAELLRSAIALLESTPGLDWAGLPPQECASLGCGYQYRCHSQAAGL
jgi:ATP-dependent exoDNAse (exonuclease V) beta subunit